MAQSWQEILDNFSGSSKATTVTQSSPPKSNQGAREILDDFSGSSRKKKYDDAIAPVASRVKTKAKKKKKDEEEEEEKKKRKWFDKGLFDDGYDFGDITKTILGTGGDVVENLGTGIAGMGEKVVDAGAYLAPYMANGQFYQNGGIYDPKLVEQQEKVFEQSKEDMGKFIEKDLYDEEALVKGIVTGVTGVDVDDYSVLGEKSDALAQSGGQLLATVGLQAVGVPWFVTTGATSFGGEAENALREGASYGEAGASAAISAGAEILSEKLSGGISFGGKTLDDALTKQIARGISNKMGRTFAKLGMDMVGEGAEEIFSQVASNLGSSLYKEESLEELLFSEEAMDEYLESFIGGAVLGGASGSYNAVKSAKNGVDYASELTNNEQKVVDKVYKDRVAEAKKDGKVTEKQKAEIYDKVLRDMEKGYIATDTIEEVLGGEKYSQYKQAAEWEDSLQNEFDKLNKMKQGEMTGEQVDRREALRNQLKNVKATSTLTQQRTQIRDEVMSLVKGDRLVESYNEQGRRGQAFEADLSKYDAKQQAVIQKAIDSGILNNTNRTHEFVDIISKISADKGVLFDFTNNTKLKESGFAIDGKQVNGFVTKDGITLNIDSPKAWQSTVGHEVTHVLEGTEFYTELQNTLFEYAKTKGEYDSRIQTLTELYKDVKDADINAELTADLVGEYLFTDENFIKNLSVEHRNVFQKIYDEIKYLYKVATGSKEAKELEKVKRAFEKAYKEGGKTLGDTKYSLTEAFTDSNGTQFNNAVLLDTDFFDGTPPRKWGDELRKKVEERAKDDPFILPIADENGNTTLLQFASPQDRVTKDGRSNHKVLDKLSSSSDNISKLAVIHIDEIVSVSEENSPYYTNEHNHQWLDQNGWLHRNANVINQKNGNIYNLTVDIAKAADGRTILYATDGKIKKVGNVQVNSLKIKGSGQNSNFNTKVTQKGEKVKYSLSDSKGRELSPGTAKRFGNSKVVDENGSLKVVYHGTASGEFTIFDKAKGSVEGDFGSGFYFTDNESDVSEHYEGGGPDFDNKVARLAEQIEADEDIDYEEAEERARAELYKGSHKFEVYLNIENPAIVGETYLFDSDFGDRYNEEDFDDYDEYIAETEQAVADAVDEIIWEVEKNVDVYSTDGLADVIYEAYYEGGIGIEELKEKINNLYLEDNNGNLVGNEVARQIIESLGYDGIIDPTVSGKWNMDIEDGTTHYIVFKPNQIKAVTNQNPTDNPDIHRSLSNVGEQHTPDSLSALRLETDDIAPVAEESSVVAENATTTLEAPIYESNDKSAPEGQTAMFEPVEEKRTTRKEYHQGIIDNIKSVFKGRGFDFDKVLKNAKNLSTWSTVDNTPQRVMEKALGYKEGGILADITVNKVAQNETEGIKWLNAYVDQLKQISKQCGIKPGSKESAAAQMFAEGFYVNENNEIVRYGEPELIQDFGNADVRRRIKGLARDPRIRKIYDDTLASINESRTRNLYPEIPRLDNYFLHFRAMNDTFSTLGLPFNPNDIRAKDLPTDLNGVTADLKPGQPFFSSAMHRTGKRTSFDLLGGVERYLNSAKNQIYHIDDIQTLRALRNYIADTYGQAKGLENLDELSQDTQWEQIKKVYNSHLSTFAKFLNEEANILAGKTTLIDRGAEGLFGRRAMTFMKTLSGQVGSNQVGYNISSSLTNFMPVAQTFANTNKFDFIKAFGQTVLNKFSGGRFDTFSEDSPVVIRRKGEDRFYQTPWQKMQNPGYALMGAVDNISTELIARTKYNEFTRKGMDSQKAHFETDKWVSKLMGDRSLGQQPQLYNSNFFGLFTKYQLEVRNYLDSAFYDTIQEVKASNEDIQNGLARNAKTAAKVTSRFIETAVVMHLFGKAFESVAGYNPSFDIVEALMTAFGYDDDEESEDTTVDNLAQALMVMAEDMPYASFFLEGGRIPVASAIPDVPAVMRGEDQYGNDIGWKKAAVEEFDAVAPYYLLPGGGGQIKKTVAGLKMFSDDHPIAGSYTEAGNLRYPVEDTAGNRIKAGIFGQYASENAQKYFDQEQRTLNPEQTEIFAGLDIPIEEYWEYRDDLYEFYDVRDALKDAAFADEATDEDVLRYTYINNAYGNIYDLYDKQKEIASGDSKNKKSDLRKLQDQMKQMLTESKYAVDRMKLTGLYGEVGDKRYNKDADSGRWYEIKPKNADGSDNWYYQKEQEVTKGLGISYEEYWNNREEYNYAYDKPGRYEIAKAVGGYDTYMEYYDVLENWQSDNYLGADKDSKGNSISGSRKKKVLDYINGLDIDYGERLILYRTVYSSKADKRAYNQQIIDYLNERDDISYQEMKTILEELDMEVDSKGYITW